MTAASRRRRRKPPGRDPGRNASDESDESRLTCLLEAPRRSAPETGMAADASFEEFFQALALVSFAALTRAFGTTERPAGESPR
jgi:hypothetical protein